MKEEHYKWYSPDLGMETEMLVFGERGTPVILFPTSMGRFFENKDFKLIESASWFIDNGLVRIYCPDGIDTYSWYNKNVHPSQRVQNHLCYDRMIYNDVVHKARVDCNAAKVVTAGCSFGAYHATNFAFKHPEAVSHVFNMGGAFDIKDQMDGYYDDNVYFNNPVDFIADASDENLWSLFVILGTAEHDFCKGANIYLSEILNRKGIKNWLDIRYGNHDWPVWREMFPHYLSLL